MANIVIAGSGKVGFHIASTLLKEGHNIIIIEQDKEAFQLAESLDALVITGNAASPKVLADAYISSADIFIGVTGSDEVNLLSCAIAKANGCKTIARVNGLDYMDEPISTTKFTDIGVDIAICPELVSAIKMINLLTISTFLDSNLFAQGKVQVMESRIEEDAPILGKPIKNIPFPKECNVVAIYRDADIMIPHGPDTFFPMDRVISILSDDSVIPNLQRLFGVETSVVESKAIERVMIYGATRIGIHVAKHMSSRDMSVILIDEDAERCRSVSEILPKVLVIQGSATDKDVLVDEGVRDVDAFLSLTNSEETNVLAALMAKQYGAKQTIALVDRTEMKSMLEEVGIDLAVSPRLATVSAVLKYTHNPDVISISLMHSTEAQVVEMKVPSSSRLIGKKLKKVTEFRRNALLGAVVRKGRVIIPHGDFVFARGDRLVIFVMTSALRRIEALVTK